MTLTMVPKKHKEGLDKNCLVCTFQKEQSLKAKIAELTTKNLSQQKDMKNLKSEVAEARRQVKLAFRYNTF